MFSSAERLQKRTPNNGIDRAAYIQLLSEEFLETTDLEAKIQISANLANFAYDPINYAFLRTSRVPELYLNCLTAPEDRLVQHGIAGLCNSCLDPEIRQLLISLDAISSITPLLWSTTTTNVVNALTTLMFLFGPDTKSALTNPEILPQIRQLAKSSNKQIRNAATLYLIDYVGVHEKTVATS